MPKAPRSWKSSWPPIRRRRAARRRFPIWGWHTLNLGDKEKSLRYYDG